MRPDPAMARQWREEAWGMARWDHHRLEGRRGTAVLGSALPTHADILDFLAYTPSERDQGSCGNCWVWGSTALAEVELAARYGLKDRLSIQFLNSGLLGSFACSGGSLYKFTLWYNNQKQLVPWSNANAEFRDGAVNRYCTQSLVDPGVIARSPAYPLITLTPYILDPQVHTQAQMVEAIQTALANHKAVGLSYTTDFTGSTGFQQAWDTQAEGDPWINRHEGDRWDSLTWGSHMVVVVGFEAEDPDPAKHCWIVLNSWGAPLNRPHGFFRLPMQMNYQATYTAADGKPDYCYLFQTLDLKAAPPAPTAPTVEIAYSTPTPRVAQSLALSAQVAGTPPFTYQWRKDGAPIPGATSAQFVLPFLQPEDAGPAYDVIVGNTAGTRISLPLRFPVEGQNLLANPGLETQGGWITTSTLGLNPWHIGPDGAAFSHSGQGFANLGGARTDGVCDPASTFSQSIQVPDQPGILTLSWWMKASTAETTPNATDSLQVALLDEHGALLQTLKTCSNLDFPYLLWRQETLDLSSYKGRTVQLQAQATQDSARATTFSLDDFGLVLAPAPLALSLAPRSLALLSGQPATLWAHVSNSANNEVAWTVETGGLDKALTHTPDAQNTWALPTASGTYTLAATLTENPLVKDQATVRVVNEADINLVLTPAVATLLPGQSLNLQVQGDGGGGVTWTWDPALSFSANGLAALVGAPAAVPLQTRVFGVRAASSLLTTRLREAVITVKSMDLNQDGGVDARDLLLLSAAWGKDMTSPANLKGSGQVDETDLTALLLQLK